MDIFRTQHDGRHLDRPNLPAPQTSGGLRGRRLRGRYGIELFGALLFIGAIIAFNSFDRAANSPAASTQNSTAHSTTLSLPATDDKVGAPQSASTNVSQEVTTMPNSADNGVTTKVTVNGVDVPVPATGTSQQTIVGDGSPTSVTITTGQATTGQASNTNRSSMHLNVSTTTRSNDSTIESRSGTP